VTLNHICNIQWTRISVSWLQNCAQHTALSQVSATRMSDALIFASFFCLEVITSLHHFLTH